MRGCYVPDYCFMSKVRDDRIGKKIVVLYRHSLLVVLCSSGDRL